MNAVDAEIQTVDRSYRLQVGGTLNPKKHTYIQRPEDEEVLQLLLAGEYVNVLTSRQMGKSSLMAKMTHMLEGKGVRFVSIDLAGELGAQADAIGYYQGLLQQIASKLELPIDLKTWWQEHDLETNNQKLLRFFKDEVGGAIETPVVVFLDEIDSTLSLPFTDDLFTAFRTMHNERPFEEVYRRITLCLLGVATPNELIKDRRTTPYNVGRTLELRDFDAERDDLTSLALALSPILETGQALLARVLYWTGGHPYLTNKLCYDLAAAGVDSPEEVNQHVQNTFRTLERMSDNVHIQQILRFVEERFTKELDSLDLYARVQKGARERDQPSLAHIELKLSGLVKRDDEGCLMVRNPIYARLFDDQWVASTRPKRTLSRTRNFAIAASIALGLLAGGGALYQTQVVGPQQQVFAVQQQKLAERTKFDEMHIVVVPTEGGYHVIFPAEADQDLLEKALPLLLDLPGKVIKLDLRPDFLEREQVEVVDLALLAQFTDLEVLDVAGTRIANLEPLEKMTKLRRLGLNDTEVTDLTPLGNLKSLKLLNLDNNQISNIEPLEGLRELQILQLTNTQVTNIDPLKELSNLQELFLNNSQVTNINALEDHAALEKIILNNTEVSDVSALKKPSGIAGSRT